MSSRVTNKKSPTAEETLKRFFGYDSFRPDQAPIVNAVCAGRDVLAVMPTGAGKSICYQVPAIMAGGITVVVSPLISLMKDQVNALVQSGVTAAFVNSSLTVAAQSGVLQEVAAGKITLLYVSPERLIMPSFIEFARNNPPALVAIDEAHCISQWGQDFRPSYTRITEFLDALDQRPPVCAFTATATSEVRDDIRRELSLRDPYMVTAGFDRPNLHFAVQHPKSKKKALLAFIRAHRDRTGIVYCTSRKGVEDVCEYLCDQGFAATRYHAGLSAVERRDNQDAFLYDRSTIMVATNAFGMGIDKSNVGFVVHYNMPLDLESYYQEAGRAGRDGDPAECLLLYAPKDVRTAEFLITNGIEESPGVDGPTRALLVARAKDRLRMMTFYSTTHDCLRGFILKYFGESSDAFCGNCSNCETEFEQQDVTLEAQKIISCVYRLEERDRRVGKTTIVDILHGSAADKMTLSGFDTLSTYGIMKADSAARIRHIIDRLVDDGILTKTEGSYPVILFNERSGRFLKDRETFEIMMPRETPREQARKQLAQPISHPPDPSLFQKLKELRADVAAEAGVPAYVVFSNHTLHDMCRVLPTDRETLLDVSGVGEVKADRYGQAFLECIATHRAAEESARDTE